MKSGDRRRGDEADAARRAQRLLRWYPPAWRRRYGEEFTLLLIADIAERPASPARTTDVIRAGLRARLADAGLTGNALEPARRLRASLAIIAGALTVFLIAGVALWSQLTVGWQWSAPAAPATRAGMLVMSGVAVAFPALALLAALPLIWVGGRSLRCAGGRAGLVAPLALVAVGLLVLVWGSIHFGHGWPGTGGHPWRERDLVPGGVARFAWAATLWISSYWAHPGALASFPAAEVAWMAASPAALLATAIGTARMLRRLPLSPRMLRYELGLGIAASGAMAAFLAGAGSWVISGGPAPRGLFRVGVIDDLGLAVMAAALVLAAGAGRRALGTPAYRA